MDQCPWLDRSHRLLLVVLGLLGCVAGCAAVGAAGVSTVALGGQVIAGRGQDVTANDIDQGEALWQFYRRGATYELNRDVFYGKAYANPLGLDDLIRPGHGLSTIPTTIEAYAADPARWPAIKGVIPGRHQAARGSRSVHADLKSARLLLRRLDRQRVNRRSRSTAQRTRARQAFARQAARL